MTVGTVLVDVVAVGIVLARFSGIVLVLVRCCGDCGRADVLETVLAMARSDGRGDTVVLPKRGQ